MALTHESLWQKSKMFTDRALSARDRDEGEDFYLWMALVLELLGKAHLAKLHPALVADPLHSETLLAVCGGPQTRDHRSITAKTVFERCVKTVPGFDSSLKEFCLGLANDWNAHLHSGEVPFAAKRSDAWQSKCWSVIQLLVGAQGRPLEELVGSDEAAAIRKIISDAKQLEAVHLERRIASYAAAFKKLDFEETHLRQSAAKLQEQRISQSADSTRTTHRCPACGNPGALDGDLVGEIEGDSDPEEPWLRWFDCTIVSSEFRCAACGLKLDGGEEVVAAGLPEEYERTMLREVDDGDEYGND